MHAKQPGKIAVLDFIGEFASDFETDLTGKLAPVMGYAAAHLQIGIGAFRADLRADEPVTVRQLPGKGDFGSNAFKYVAVGGQFAEPLNRNAQIIRIVIIPAAGFVSGGGAASES